MKYTGNKENEVFVGNVMTKTGIPSYLRNLKTVRLGEQALDLNGKPLDPAFMLPMFVGREDYAVYGRIMSGITEQLKRGY